MFLSVYSRNTVADPANTPQAQSRRTVFTLAPVSSQRTRTKSAASCVAGQGPSPWAQMSLLPSRGRSEGASPSAAAALVVHLVWWVIWMWVECC